MANFQVSYSWMMDNEDAPRAYSTVPDVGGQAISGINSASYPEEFSTINALPQSERGPAVEQFYQTHFWNQWYAQIASDEVAKRVFDSAVNMGPATAVKLLQEAVDALGGSLTVDGGWGPMTVIAVNACDAGTLVSEFKAQRCSHYQAIVAKNPASQRYLSAWMARAVK